MGYRLDIYRFPGSIEYEYKYAGDYGAKGEKRAPKQKRTPEDIRRQNLYNKQKNVRRLIAGNFGKGDYWTTLTYRKGTVRSIREASEDLRRFLDRIRRCYRKAGAECRYIYRIEIGSRGGVHVHLILNRIPDLDLIIREKWENGHIHSEPLDDGPYDRLAEYIVKPPTDQQKKLLKALALEDEGKVIRYSCSRNLKRPVPERKEIRNRTMRTVFNSDLVPTEGFYINRDSIRRGINAYTGMSYLSYREARLKDKIRPEPVRICECPYCHQFTLDAIECRCRFEPKRRRRRASG